MRWGMYDRYGNHIYLTQERWEHALAKCPWLNAYFDVLETIRHGRRQQEPLQPYKYKYYWPCIALQPEFNHLVVVVIFQETTNTADQSIPNNYVVNIWAVYLYSRR